MPRQYTEDVRGGRFGGVDAKGVTKLCTLVQSIMYVYVNVDVMLLLLT